MFLARKIGLAKWEPRRGFTEGEISADAITGDLRTRDNSLSFWRCGEGAAHDVEEVALAIATAGDRLGKLDIVWLAEADLRDDGQFLRDSDGRTPVRDLAGRHVDVSHLDYARLGKVARLVVGAIRAGQCRRLGKPQVRQLVAVAVRGGRIDPDTLPEGVRKEMAR